MAPAIEESSDRGTSTAGRKMIFGARPFDAAVWRGRPAQGERIEGPAAIELAESTIVVPPGWHAVVDSADAVALKKEPK